MNYYTFFIFITSEYISEICFIVSLAFLLGLPQRKARVYKWVRVYFLHVTNLPRTSSARAQDKRVCVEKVSGLQRSPWCCVCTRREGSTSTFPNRIACPDDAGHRDVTSFETREVRMVDKL